MNICKDCGGEMILGFTDMYCKAECDLQKAVCEVSEKTTSKKIDFICRKLFSQRSINDVAFSEDGLIRNLHKVDNFVGTSVTYPVSNTMFTAGRLSTYGTIGINAQDGLSPPAITNKVEECVNVLLKKLGSTISEEFYTQISEHFPLFAPTSGDVFRGVDRSVDTRLSGFKLDRPEIGIFSSAVTVYNNTPPGPKIVLLNPAHSIEANQLGLDFHLSPYVPRGLGYVIDRDEVHITSLLGFPHLADVDGKISVRGIMEDTYVVRARAWWNVIIDPTKGGVFSIK